MRKLREIYKRNIYGVMGTLMFHILLFSAFLLAEVDIKGDLQEEQLVIEFPDVLPEQEFPEDQNESPDQEEQDIPSDPSSQLSREQIARTNIASNKMAESDEFFDDDYLNEVEAAKQLVSDVNNQLSKKAIDIEDIDMPVETTGDMDPDSIKNVIYTGESNIVYYLENRYHLSLPIPVYLAQGGGKVIVDIAVDREGRVVKADPRDNPAIRDEQIFLYAVAAASRTLFNKDPGASEIQRGTIHYNFVAQ